ncbi:RNA-directed DNA polymerase, eukaryota, reverse transcriptase zinc-binding domain protein, partial [Tanacetum coccineum]
LYNGIHIAVSLSLSHFFYADDVVFVGKWSLSNLSTIVKNVVILAARSIGCLTFFTPFTYLGVKVGGIMSRLNSWKDVVAKLTSRLSKWKLKTLSIGSKGVLSKIESTSRNFFNGVVNSDKNVSLICWKKVLASKKNGGLGVSTIHGVRGALENPLTFSRRSPWFDIGREFRTLSNNGIDLLSLVKKKVGNGVSTSFWDDVWLVNSPLKQVYPWLYLLEADKHSSVAAKLSDPTLSASFGRPPRGGIEEEQLQLLVTSTSSIILPNISDRWIWNLDPSGAFSVKSTRNFIDDSFLPRWTFLRDGLKLFPSRSAWKVYLDKLPTRLNLSLRGLDIPSIICPLYSIKVESTSHRFFSCHLARQLMLKVAHWWELEIHDFISYDDWLLWLNNL